MTLQMTKKSFDFDLICIGGGSAGLSCAKEANSLGAKVAVIDFVMPTPMGTKWGIGGTCVNVGCIPKKHMHYASLLGNALHDATYYGWEIPNEENIKINWEKLISEIRAHIKSTNWTIKIELRKNNIKYFNGIASFIDAHTLCIKLPQENEDKLVTAMYILIATGTRPIYPDIPGAREYGITSDDLFFLNKPPGKTLLVGAGYVSLECAGFLNEYGFDTTIAVRREILRGFDRDMVKHIQEHLELRGITFLKYHIAQSIDRTKGGRLLVKFLNLETNEEDTDVFDTVIFAIGRKPLLDDLNVKAINLTVVDNEIVVNKSDETSVANIFALGDVVKGIPKLTPVAILAGRLLAQRLFNNSIELMDYSNVPTTIFTPLEYSCVGLSEEAAIKTFGHNNVDVYHAYYEPIHFLVTNRPTQFCYVKIITKRPSDDLKVLGIHFLGPDAGEVMQGFAVAIKCGITLKQLFSTLGVHITNAEELTNIKVTKRSGLDPITSMFTR